MGGGRRRLINRLCYHLLLHSHFSQSPPVKVRLPQSTGPPRANGDGQKAAAFRPSGKGISPAPSSLSPASKQKDPSETRQTVVWWLLKVETAAGAVCPSKLTDKHFPAGIFFGVGKKAFDLRPPPLSPRLLSLPRVSSYLKIISTNLIKCA